MAYNGFMKFPELALRIFPLVRATLVGIIVATHPAAGVATAAKNVVIMIADDLAWNDLGCYGHPRIKTPNIDRLAAGGMTFDNAFLTTSSCSPSRCSIMTGRFPHSTGAGELHLPLPADQVTFPKLLKAAGYYTAAAGKWHLGNLVTDHFSKIYGRGGASGSGDWVKAVSEIPEKKNFFLWLAASDPHRGWSRNAIPEPHQREDVVLPPFLPDTPEIRDDFTLYYDEVSRFDHYVGLVVEALGKRGLLESTLILVMSDNGRPFPRCKTTLYDSGIKTPFVASMPGTVPSGVRSESLVSAVDIAPTVLELAGIAAQDSFQGKSFVRVLHDPEATIQNYVHAEHNWHDYRARERSVRTKHFLYIANDFPGLPATPPADAVNSPTWASMRQLLSRGKLTADQFDCFVIPRPEEQLFDVISDPFQLKNLASIPAYQKRLQIMRGIHNAWTERTKDERPKNLDEEVTRDGFDRVTGKKLIRRAHPSFD